MARISPTHKPRQASYKQNPLVSSLSFPRRRSQTVSYSSSRGYKGNSESSILARLLSSHGIEATERVFRASSEDVSISQPRSLPQQQDVNKSLVSPKYSSSPRIASLVGNLEKDYEKLCSNYPQTVKAAERLIEKLHLVALKNNWWWYVPLFNITFENEIVLEWWHQEKKITIYVYEEVIDYIRVWGADMDNEMEDGSISLEDDLTDLWQWIAS